MLVRDVFLEELSARARAWETRKGRSNKSVVKVECHVSMLPDFYHNTVVICTTSNFCIATSFLEAKLIE